MDRYDRTHAASFVFRNRSETTSKGHTIERLKERLVQGALILTLVGTPLIVLRTTSDPTAIKGTLARILLLGAAAIWLMGGIWAERFSLRRSLLNLPLLLYFLASVVSVCISGYRYASVDRLTTVGACCWALFLALNAFRDQEGIRRILYILVGVGCLTSLYGILQYFGVVGGPHELDGFLTVEYLPRAFSTLGHPNLFGGLLVLILPIALGLLLGEESRGKKIALAAAIVLMGIALLYTRSRGAWIGSILALAGAVALRLRWTTRRIALVLVGVLILGAVLWSAVPSSFVRRAQSIENIGPRGIMWRAAAGIFRERPVLGQGIGTFQIHYPRYRPNDYWLLGLEPNVLHAHNEYLEILAEMGGIGLITFAGVIFAFFVALSAVLRRDRGPAGDLAAGLCASVAGTLLHNTVSVSLRWISTGALFWLVLGIGGALAAASHEKRERCDASISFNLPRAIKGILSASLVIALVLLASVEIRAVLSQQHLLSGRQALSKEHRSRGIVELRRAIELDRDNLSAYYKLGAALVERGEHQAGLDTYRELTSRAPEYTEIHHNIGAAFARIGDLDAAISEYRRALEAHDTERNRYDLATLYEKKGRTSEAIPHYERFVALAEQALRIHQDREVRAAKYRREEDAERERQTIRTTIRRVCRAYARLVDHRARASEWADLVSLIDRARVRCGDTARSWHTKGFAAEQLGRIEDALDAYRKVLEIDSTHAEAMNNLAFLYADRGEHLDEALRLVQRAIEQAPGDRSIYLDTLGWVHCRREEYREAIQVLREGLDEAEAPPSILAEMSYHLGAAYYGAGQLSSAANALRRAIGWSPDGPTAAKAQRMLDEIEAGGRRQETGDRTDTQ